MKFCKNCGNQLEDGATFCGKCGAALERKRSPNPMSSQNRMLCKYCGNKIKEGAMFCNQCGNPIDSQDGNASVSPDSSQVFSEQNAAFQEKVYTFKSIYTLSGRGADVFDLIFSIPKMIKGIDASLVISDDMVIIMEERKYQNKVTGIPYNEIQSFEMKNKLNVWILITIVVCTLLLVGACAFTEVSPFLCLLCFIWLIFSAVISLVRTIFFVRVSDGRTIKIKLKRIGSKLEMQKNEFLGELHKMVLQVDTVQDITKKQSKIVIGYTKADWKSLIQDVTGGIVGDVVGGAFGDTAGKHAENVASKIAGSVVDKATNKEED